MPGRFGRRRRRKDPERPGEGEDRRGSSDDLAAAATELSHVLGQAPMEEARAAAIERLTEKRAAGEISEETFAREKKRLTEYG